MTRYIVTRANAKSGKREWLRVWGTQSGWTPYRWDASECTRDAARSYMADHGGEVRKVIDWRKRAQAAESQRVTRAEIDALTEMIDEMKDIDASVKRIREKWGITDAVQERSHRFDGR